MSMTAVMLILVSAIFRHNCKKRPTLAERLILNQSD
jgi:hypothetical protein